MALRAPGHRRRVLSMTSLIDVIFLLLLFFMLTSTFSKFSEVRISGGGSGAGPTDAARPMFLQVLPDRLSLNGETVAPDALVSALGDAEGMLLVGIGGPEVTAQRLTDILVALSAVPDLTVRVLN